MEFLFKRHKPRRGRVVLMLAGSLVIHGGLVGIGALLVQPAPQEVLVDWDPTQYDGPEVLRKDEIPEQPTTMAVAATASPEPVDSVDSNIPPPAVEDLAMAEPASPTPQQRLNTKPVLTAKTGSSHASSTITNVPGPGHVGSTTNGASDLPASWVMPHPPYPPMARRLATGSGLTTVRITTDAMGRISSAVVVRSTGNPLLDAHTISYVRDNWRGPANASRTTEFLYQLR